MISSLLIPALSAVLATSAPQQSAQAIIQTMQEKQAERWATVENYTVVQSLLGMQTPMYYEKILVGEDKQPVFRMVPAMEYQAQPEGGARGSTSAMADAYELMADSMQGQGMPGFSTGPMLRDMATFLRAGSNADVNDGRADAASRAGNMTALTQRARLIGRETVDGREAFLIRAENLSDIEMEQSGDGGEFTLHTMSMWIDTREYVPLRFKMEGEIASDGQVMPMIIEKLDQDYRQVGPMYEPHRQVVRLSGMELALDPKQRAEMERARAQMEQMKEQLAQMPEAQRRLIEGRMKSAMDQMERMTGGDGSLFETVIDVVSIQVNEGPPTAAGMARVVAGGRTARERNPGPDPVTEPASAGQSGRSDLDRFRGVYGIPNQSGPPRNLFVTVSCDGQLVAGAMWGDASNWWMTSVGDTEFEMSDQFRSLRLRFDIGPDGNARAMRHDLDGMPSPLSLIGPLPDEWSGCIRDMRG